MSRFRSFKYIPAETRRILRDRFGRKLVVTNNVSPVTHNAKFTSDILAFQLLDRLITVRNDDWMTAEVAYKAANPVGSEPRDLRAAIAAGWLRQVWGRVKIPQRIRMMVRRAPSGTMNAFKNLVTGIHGQSYDFLTEPPIEADLISLISDIKAGRIDPAQIAVRTPDWIAARLWEATLAREPSVATALRHWIDLYGLLHLPELVPMLVWSAEDAETFKAATLELIASDPAFSDWPNTRDLYAKQAAVAHNLTAPESAYPFPTPPTTLVGRALWCDQQPVESFVRESLDAGGDIFALMWLLLADADHEDYSSAPHAMVTKILDLAIDRAELFIAMLFYVRRRPRLLADLLLDPRSAALACLVIAQWQQVGGAWDRELVERGSCPSTWCNFRVYLGQSLSGRLGCNLQRL